MFELKVPRLQIRFGGSGSAGDDDNEYENERERIKIKMKEREKGEEEDEKKVLRGEIRNWYKGVFDHLNKLVCFFPFLSLTFLQLILGDIGTGFGYLECR
jgi:1-phosphatidylinositol-3-phosphate 5-kinase